MADIGIVRHRPVSLAVRSLIDDERPKTTAPQDSRMDMAVLVGPQRWCVRCQEERPMAGGKTNAGMFFCSLHQK